MIAKVRNRALFQPWDQAARNPSFLLRMVLRVTKSDGIRGKLEVFWTTFCQESPVQACRSPGCRPTVKRGVPRVSSY